VNHPIVLRLVGRTPFDWEPIAAFLAARAIPSVEVVEGERYRRSIRLGGVPATLDVAPDGEAGLRANVVLDGPSAAPPTAVELEARLRRWFDLDADIEAIGRHLARDPALAPLVAARPGLRVPGAWDPFELAVRAIVGQQISVAGARTIAGRLASRFGARRPAADGDVAALFPSPDRLAAADMTGIGMPGARASAIVGFAAAVVAEPGLLAPSDDLDDIVRRLRGQRGIGEWTAQYIALRGLKHPDAFPASDLGILRALADHDGRRPTPAEALTRAELGARTEPTPPSTSGPSERQYTRVVSYPQEARSVPRNYVRLTEPLVRDVRGGDLRPASWDEALQNVVDGFQAAKAAHGPTTFGVFSCSKATNEVNFAAQKFARIALGSNNIDSCNRT
jgi:3-methyladenine DNA glycosylase/8-oxoguanine DNA glycosylase